MRKYLLNKSIKNISKYYNFDDSKIIEIRYGLETLYITVTKLIVIAIACYLLNIFKEFLCLMLFYCPLRSVGGGVHAQKSIHCWIASLISFTLCPLLIKIFTINSYELLIIIIVSFILILLYSPADTIKKPINSFKKRSLLKKINLILLFVYILLTIISKNLFITNSIAFALLLECFVICPLSYSLFGVKFNKH